MRAAGNRWLRASPIKGVTAQPKGETSGCILHLFGSMPGVLMLSWSALSLATQQSPAHYRLIVTFNSNKYMKIMELRRPAGQLHMNHTWSAPGRHTSGVSWVDPGEQDRRSLGQASAGGPEAHG